MERTRKWMRISDEEIEGMARDIDELKGNREFDKRRVETMEWLLSQYRLLYESHVNQSDLRDGIKNHPNNLFNSGVRKKDDIFFSHLSIYLDEDVYKMEKKSYKDIHKYLTKNKYYDTIKDYYIELSNQIRVRQRSLSDYLDKFDYPQEDKTKFALAEFIGVADVNIRLIDSLLSDLIEIEKL